MIRLLPGTCCLHILLLVFLCVPAYGEDSAKILIFNSYHKGYSWSDQIVSGIESTLLHSLPATDIRIEYMDTKRNTTRDYLEQISAFYYAKYRAQPFDLLIACDDNAIQFLLGWADYIFPDTPIIFCGANAVDLSHVRKRPGVTGILERAEILKTLDIAKKLRPETRKLLVINDSTITGRNVRRDFNALLPQIEQNYAIELLPDLPLEELAEQVAEAEQDTAILLLAYLRDQQGKYYPPEITARKISEAAPVPVYSVWDFYFNHGIVGGSIISGYLQGEAAADIALQVLAGTPAQDIPIASGTGNRLEFDYRQMERFGLSLSKLPQEAIVQNITYNNQHHILALHSYSADSKWTASIMTGIEDYFAERQFTPELHVEYMDTKRFFDKAYLNSLKQLLTYKYDRLQLDLIIVSDDNAYDFVLRNRSYLFAGIPIIFCGVNYLENTDTLNEHDITGVVESYDILGTLRLALDTFPNTRNIFIINDTTTTGKANQLRLEEIVPELPANITLTHCGAISMQDLQRQVATLGDDTVALLMSFTRDKNNHRFSYTESARLISRSSSRPVFGFWDFYLDNGIAGGVVTSGLDQGRKAASLALDALHGRPITDLPVSRKSPVTPILDYAVLNRFHDAPDSIQAGIEILNPPPTFFEKYRGAVYTAAIILLMLLPLLGIILFFQRKTQKRLVTRVETDPLTGAKNRAYLNRTLTASIKAAAHDNTPLTLCYFDLDNLKTVNDSLGHDAGDDYISRTVMSIRKHIRTNDVICRIGGDEFIVVLPNCDEFKAHELCSAVNTDIASFTDFLDIATGVSCGVSTYSSENQVDAETLVNAADKNMYVEKTRKKGHQ